LSVKKYSKRHLAAKVRSANGLRGVFKLSEIWVTPRTSESVNVQVQNIKHGK